LRQAEHPEVFWPCPKPNLNSPICLVNPLSAHLWEVRIHVQQGSGANPIQGWWKVSSFIPYIPLIFKCFVYAGHVKYHLWLMVYSKPNIILYFVFLSAAKKNKRQHKTTKELRQNNYWVYNIKYYSESPPSIILLEENTPIHQSVSVYPDLMTFAEHG
jgi:hypothetical protein